MERGALTGKVVVWTQEPFDNEYKKVVNYWLEQAKHQSIPTPEKLGILKSV
jgi:hypothetical protein